jgi:hypothetical protein
VTGVIGYSDRAKNQWSKISCPRRLDISCSIFFVNVDITGVYNGQSRNSRSSEVDVPTDDHSIGCFGYRKEAKAAY